MFDFLTSKTSNCAIKKTIGKLRLFMDKNDRYHLFSAETQILSEAVNHPNTPLFSIISHLHDNIDDQITKTMFQNAVIRVINEKNRNCLALRNLNSQNWKKAESQIDNKTILYHLNYYSGFDFLAVSTVHADKIFVMSLNIDDWNFDFMIDAIACPNFAFSILYESEKADRIHQALSQARLIEIMVGIEADNHSDFVSDETKKAMADGGCLFFFHADQDGSDLALNNKTVRIDSPIPIVEIIRN